MSTPKYLFDRLLIFLDFGLFREVKSSRNFSLINSFQLSPVHFVKSSGLGWLSDLFNIATYQVLATVLNALDMLSGDFASFNLWLICKLNISSTKLSQAVTIRITLDRLNTSRFMLF